jgi:hypothetical protein
MSRAIASRISLLVLLALLPVGEVAARGAPFSDCNHNGIEDAIDIAFGTSSDVDRNGIPDECEETRACIRGGAEER